MCPEELRPGLARAWQVMGAVSARALHGDVQPKNLVVGPHGIGLVDWEGFWRYGVPGLDILFLGLMSAIRVPDPAVAQALATGEEPPGRQVLEALRQVGLCGERLRPALLVMLSVWAEGERRRLERAGRRGAASPFHAALVSLASSIGGAGLAP